MKKIIFAGLVLLLVNSIFPQELITVKGSDTMFILAQKWAEKYMNKDKNVVIQMIGGGSNNGITSLINGTIDLCNSSRPMFPSEREELKTRFKSLGVEIKVAQDGLSLYLNKKNPVKELTIEQVRLIYLGKITNWKEVGGDDSRIILYGRENSSGTYVYFKEKILNDNDYSLTMHSLLGTAAVASAVERDINAIGFGGVAYAKGVKFAAIKKDENSKAYLPDYESMKAGNYPFARYLYMYAQKRLTGKMKEYVDWILSPEGQKIISEVGYFPLKY